MILYSTLMKDTGFENAFLYIYKKNIAWYKTSFTYVNQISRGNNSWNELKLQICTYVRNVDIWMYVSMYADTYNCSKCYMQTPIVQSFSECNTVGR